jgi:hypothetical protein
MNFIVVVEFGKFPWVQFTAGPTINVENAAHLCNPASGTRGVSVWGHEVHPHLRTWESVGGQTEGRYFIYV